MELTSKEATHLREQLSRIIRQVHLIDQGKTEIQLGSRKGKRRLDVILDCAKDIDDKLKKL